MLPLTIRFPDTKVILTFDGLLRDSSCSQFSLELIELWEFTDDAFTVFPGLW